MSALAKAPGTRTYGSGNGFYIKEVKNTSGSFGAIAGTDVFGEAAGTFHDITSLIESPIERNEDGTFKISLKAVEDDLSRKNFALKVAPYSASAAAAKPELILEDGTILETGANTGEDTNRPYYQIAHQQVDDSTGKEVWFFAVGQFNRTTKRQNKYNTLNGKDFTSLTVNSNGYVCTKPSAAASGVTAPTLSGGNAAGIFVIEA